MSNVKKPGHSRPLSPHLQVYRPQLTSVLSISHRLAGMFLALGAIYLVLWVAAVAAGPDSYKAMQAFSASVIGRLLLLGWTVALFYHLANGLRHLFWDAGKGLDLKTAYASGWAVVAFTVLATIIAWVIAFKLRGS